MTDTPTIPAAQVQEHLGDALHLLETLQAEKDGLIRSLEVLQGEREQLQLRVHTLETLNEELTLDVRTYKTKYTTTSKEAEETHRLISESETRLHTLEQEIEDLKKQTKTLNKEKAEVEAQLRDERVGHEKAKIEWMRMEEVLREQVKTSMAKTREAKRKSLHQEQLQSVMNEQPPPLPEISETTRPRSPRGEPKIIALQEEIDKINRLNMDLTSKLEEQILTLHHLSTENDQLKQMNQSLMDETESYQILLQQQTMSGEFMNAPILKRAITRQGSSLSLKSAKSVRKPPKPLSQQLGQHSVQSKLQRAESSATIPDSTYGGSLHDETASTASSHGRTTSGESAAEQNQTTAADAKATIATELAATPATAEETADKDESSSEMISALEQRIGELEDERKALGLFIEKILRKLTTDERLEAALASPDP
ncbi:hypothetical protein HK102_006785, partial [Quaeritorhiza haematococci]